MFTSPKRRHVLRRHVRSIPAVVARELGLHAVVVPAFHRRLFLSAATSSTPRSSARLPFSSSRAALPTARRLVLSPEVGLITVNVCPPSIDRWTTFDALAEADGLEPARSQWGRAGEPIPASAACRDIERADRGTVIVAREPPASAR